MIEPLAASDPSLRTVLVVEDDVLVRLLIADVLREAGLCVVEAANADEALACLQANGRIELAAEDQQ